METLKIGICDDDIEEQDHIVKAVKYGVDVIGVQKKLDIQVYQDGKTLLEADQRERFHLVFLDIVMPFCDGFEVAAKINTQEDKPCIIFVSGYNDKIFDMYEYEPVAFVRKEKMRGDICCGLQQYFAATAKKRICVRPGGCSYKEVLIRDIVYVKYGDRTLYFGMRSGDVFQVCGSLRSMQEELVPYNLIRIHRNYLVNLIYIEKVYRSDLRLYNGTALSVGKIYRREFEEAMVRYKRRLRGEW